MLEYAFMQRALLAALVVGAVCGALMIELVARPRAVPWRTITLAAVLEVTALPDAP